MNRLVKIMERYRHPITSCGRSTQLVRRALCAGLFRNSARKDQQGGPGGYKTHIEETSVSVKSLVYRLLPDMLTSFRYMHPNSSLHGKHPEHVIYHTLVLTTKEYMNCTTTIEPKWLVEAAPTFFKVAPSDRLSKRRKAERIQPLHNKFASEDDWRLSAQKRQGRGGGGGTWG